MTRKRARKNDHETVRDEIGLRPARESDMAYVNAYAAREGMDAIPSEESVTVAVNEDDVPIGFVRAWVDPQTGQAYVNPIVVYEPWRGFGIGRMLMDDVRERYGGIRLVSRGTSLAFYRALGYTDIGWELIAPEIASDCDGCPMREECAPQPMEILR